jgi:nicotinate-nucleotide pyrophosphorylase (carboxylating)
MNWLSVDELIHRALLEDLGHGDITSELLPEPRKPVRGVFLAKQDGVLCGAEVAARCFTMLDSVCTVHLEQGDGAELAAGARFGEVFGPAGLVLAAERTALNFVQRLSGIATFTRRLAARALPYGIRIVETRKTTPGLRMLEKYAVRVGGGFNHRFDLDSCVMLKDNHFAVAGGDPEQLVLSVKARLSHTMKLIAEAQTPQMAQALAIAGADVVVLDNFAPQLVAEAVRLVGGRATIEVSGGVTEANLEAYLLAGVNVISVGALTHSYRALDISLELE